MPDVYARLRAEAVDFAALLVVWLLASVTVGSAVSAVLGLATRTRPLQTPLVVGGAVVVLLELLGRRPTVPRTAAFAVVDLLLALAVVVPAAVLTRGAGIAPAVLDLASTAVAAWIAFAGGGKVVSRARTVSYRLLRQPPLDP